MRPALNIALLLLSAIVVESLEVQNEEELREKREEIQGREDVKDLCGGCESLVTKLKKKLGDDASKAKVAKLLDEVCSTEKDEALKSACKKITGKVKDQLSESVAKGDSPKTVCKNVKLCKKKKPPPHL